MKINNDNGVRINNSIPVQHEKTERVPEQKDKSKADSLSISSDATKIEAAVKKVVAEMDTVRTERVQQLQDEIAQGKYQVDSRAIADAMLPKSE